jgi:hypothetical protein
MKAASLFIAGLAAATLSIDPANAEQKCSGTTWPVVSPVPCTKPTATSYAECQAR